MLSPSAIQRADDLVGIAMPIVPLSSALAAPSNPNTLNASVAANVANFIQFLPGDSPPNARTPKQELLRNSAGRRIHSPARS